MKPNIHPEYRHVVFRDVSCGFEFLTKSCADSRGTTEFEGEEYPLIAIDISSKSHPFYTGNQKILDTEGRVDRYYRKYGFRRDGDEEATGEEVSAQPEEEAAAVEEAPAEEVVEEVAAAEEVAEEAPAEEAPAEEATAEEAPAEEATEEVAEEAPAESDSK